jgi:hypothetical protein
MGRRLEHGAGQGVVIDNPHDLRDFEACLNPTEVAAATFRHHYATSGGLADRRIRAPAPRPLHRETRRGLRGVAGRAPSRGAASGSGVGRARGEPPWRAPRAGEAVRAQRKPRLLLRFDGSFLLRLAARRIDGLSLFQLPPRLTRADCPSEETFMHEGERGKENESAEASRRAKSGPVPGAVVDEGFATWLWIDERVASFPVHARRSLGHRLVEAVLEALVATTEAAYRPRGEARVRELERVNRALAVARILLRGARERRHLSIAQHEHAMACVDRWGRQIGGWLRAERDPAAPSRGRPR